MSKIDIAHEMKLLELVLFQVIKLYWLLVCYCEFSTH